MVFADTEQTVDIDRFVVELDGAMEGAEGLMKLGARDDEVDQLLALTLWAKLEVDPSIGGSNPPRT